MDKFNSTYIEYILKKPKEYSENVSANELEEFLRFAADKYYNSDKIVISDEMFDYLKDKLKEKAPKNKFIKEIGSPISKKKDKIKLPYPMGSLDKIKPDMDELSKWIKKYKGPYIISDKLDGSSAQLYKDKNGNMILYSRGNGIYGRDISNLIPYVIPKTVDMDELPNETSIRGEIVISKKNFEKIKNKIKNSRNTGLVTAENIDVDVALLSDFVTYAIMNPLYTQSEQMEKLKEWNFKVVPYLIQSKLTNNLLSDYLDERREKSEYTIDGIVVIDNSKVYNIHEGNPKYAFAFKNIFTDQIAETMVEEVLWNPSKDGYLKPTIKITPVNIGGTTIQYATAFNAKYILDNKLGPGSIIKIIRSGDVIPKIQEVLKPAESGKAQMPDISYYWTSTGIDIIMKNIIGAQKDIIETKKMVYFFKTLGIKYINDGIMKKFVDHGYNNIFKFLKADKKELLKINGIGDKLIMKIYDNINITLKNTKIYILMAASHIFGRGMGVRKIKVITDAYPNIMNVTWNNEEFLEKILKLEGFSNITANKFIDGFKEFKNFFNNLNKIIDIKYLEKVTNKEEKKEKKENTQYKIFNNQKIVVTGFRNKEIEEFINNNGGSIASSVSKNVSLVIYEIGTMSSKLMKANELNINVISKDDFIKTYL